MKAIINLSLIACLFAGHMLCQVGINNTDPQATLDITASNPGTPSNEDGMLLPRISQFPATNPTTTQHSMLVFLTTTVGINTPGYYYWNQPTTTWLPLGGNSDGWSLTGNGGTNPATNFLGTTDAQNFILRTNNLERIRTLSNGNVGIGLIAPVALLETGLGVDNFASIKANGAFDAYGYLGVQGATDYDGNTTLDIPGQEIGVLGISSGTSSTDNVGVYGYSNTVGVRAQHSVNNNWAELGSTNFAGNFNGRVLITGGNDASGTVGTGTLEINDALRIDSNEVITNDDTILYLQNGNNGDLLVDGTTLVVDASLNRVGVGDIAPTAKLEVYTNVASERGFRIVKTSGGADGAQIIHNGTGNGLNIRADGINAHGINAGSGGLLTNTTFGAGGPFGFDNFGADSGVAGSGNQIGIIGCAQATNSTTADRAGGWFYVQTGGGGGYQTMAFVGARVNNINYKILGSGTVSTLVKDTQGGDRIMVAPEAPEALLEDYGTGTLINGKARIAIDPILSKNIRIDKTHPLKVFIQLEGQCNGVYVTNKSATSFDVVELNNGNSNITFSYHLVANRADENRNGTISKYSEMRFDKIDLTTKRIDYMLNKTNFDENYNDPTQIKEEPRVTKQKNKSELKNEKN